MRKREDATQLNLVVLGMWLQYVFSGICLVQWPKNTRQNNQFEIYVYFGIINRHIYVLVFD